jgi:ParB/RepB/Spo0J family partition protein
MAQHDTFVGSRQLVADGLEQQRKIEALLPVRPLILQTLALDIIRPNPFHARPKTAVDPQLLQAVRDYGLSGALRVRPDPMNQETFQLVFGDKWLRLAREAPLRSVDCEIATYSDDEMLEIGLLENIHQRALEPLEEAFALRMLLEQRGYTLPDLARFIGSDEQSLTRRLALLTVPRREMQTRAQHQTYPDHSGLAMSQPRSPAQANTSRSDEARAAPIQAMPGNDYSRRTLEHDMHTLRIILAHWQQAMKAGEPYEREFIISSLAELHEALQQLEAQCAAE